MKNLFVTDLKPGMSVFGEDFAVKSLAAATSRDGRTYYNVELTDKTGSIKGKIWPDALPNTDITTEGKIAAVNASIESYRDEPQIKITSLAASTEYNDADFMAKSDFDCDKMWQELVDYMDKVKNKHLRQLLKSVFDEKTAASFRLSAAGISVHHAYNGGLLEHTLEMLRMSDGLGGTFPKLNKDLLVTGIILHDIGKIFEYQTGLTIKMTTQGKLQGHIFLGANYIAQNMPTGIPSDLQGEIVNVILSHHGELEFGSPVKPKTPEAFAVAMLDNVSAKTNASYHMIQTLGDGVEFSAYHRQLGTEIYKSPYLDELVNEDLPF